MKRSHEPSRLTISMRSPGWKVGSEIRRLAKVSSHVMRAILHHDRSPSMARGKAMDDAYGGIRTHEPHGTGPTCRVHRPAFATVTDRPLWHASVAGDPSMTRVSRDERIRLRALANPAGPSLMRDLLDDYDDAGASSL